MFAQPIFGQCTFTFTPALPAMPCPGEVVTFTVTNPMMGSVYEWDLDGDGMYDDKVGNTVTFTYPYSATQKTYDVKLEKDGTPCPGMQSIVVKAGEQPTLGVVMGGALNGQIISSCNGGPIITIKINNTSPNPTNFVGYTINWGDGTPPVINLNNTNFNQNATLMHDYAFGSGYKTITLTGTNANGCVLTNIYQFFSGGNPSIGLSSVGNTGGLCAPTTLTFNVKDYELNSLGTTYQFYENLQPVGPLYTQATLPNPFVFTHLFDNTSCGETTPTGILNAFAIKIVAQNPCDFKEGLVQPITVSTKPNPDFSIQAQKFCPFEEVTFMNTSTNINEFNTQTKLCADSLNANWEITPGILGVDWELLTPSFFNYNKIKVRFLKPGSYNITMTLNPQPVCGPSTITKTITVLEPPTAIANAQFSNPNGCSPLTVNFNNQSTGFDISYKWDIAPATGWSWQPGGGTGSVTIKDPSAEFIVAGTYTVTLTVTNVCATSTWTQTIVVKEKPTVTLPSLGPFCQTATLNFTAPNAPGYTNGNGTISAYSWSFPGGSPGTSTAQNPTGIQYGPVASTTTFTYTAAVTNECGTNTATGTFEVQVPAVLTLPPDKGVCINAPAFPLNAMPAGGTWTGTGITNPAGNFDPANAGGPGVKTLTYSYGAAGSPCTATKTMTITVFALPVVDVPLTASSCVNQTAITLTSMPATGGIWTSSGNGQIMGNVFNPSTSGVNTYTLTYSVTDMNGCANSDQLTMTVNALPVVSSSDISYCNTPGMVDLPAASPAPGTWSGPGIMGNQFDPQTPGGPTFIATYSYTSPQTGCSNTANITITVTNPANLNAGADKVFCLNDAPFDLNSDAVPATGGTWSGTGVSGNMFDPAIAGPGTFIIILKLGSGNCLVNDTRTIIVNPLPVVAAGPDAKNCISDTQFSLSPSPSMGGTWTSSGSGQVTGNTFNAAASGVGTYTLTYTFTDNNSCKNSDQLTMVVHPLPVLMSSDVSFCNTSGLVPLPVATPSGGTWTGTGVTGNQFNPQTPGGPTFIATYAYTDPQTTCSNTVDITITVTDPANVSAGADKVFCISDAPFDLNTDAIPASGGFWTGPGVTGNTFNPMTAGAGMHVITLSTGTGNCLVTAARTITVHPLPMVVAGPDVKDCINETQFQLLPNPSTGGVWTSTGTGQITGNTFNASTSGVGTYTLTYTFTDVNGCINSDQLTMIVNPLPVILVNDTVYCNTPGLVLLPVVNPIGGTWSGIGVGVGADNNKFDPQTAGGPNFLATYTYTNPQTTCVNTKTINISVIDPANINAGADKNFCIDDAAFDLNSDATPASGGVWLGTGVSGNTFSPMVAGEGTFTIQFSTGTGNCTVTSSRSITVHPLPMVAAGLDNISCISDTVIALSPTPSTGTWTSNGTGQVAGNNFNPAASGVGSYTLTYSLTDVNGCSNQDALTMTVNPLPQIFVNDTVYCNTPGLVLLPVVNPNGGSWSGIGVGMGADDNKFDPQTTGGPNFVATYTYTNPQTTCTNTESIDIMVIAPDNINAGMDRSFCMDDAPFDLNLDAIPVTGGNWTGPGVSGSLFDPAAAGVGQHIVQILTGFGNCAVTDTRTLQVNPLPGVSAGMDDAACVSESSVTLNPSPNGGAWNPGNAVLSGNTVQPDSSGIGSFSLIWSFTDSLGCKNSDSLLFTVNPLPIPISQDTSFCNTAGLVLLPVSSPVGGSWTGVGTSGFNFDPIGAGGVGNYPQTYHYTDQNGCTDSITITVTVTEPIPAIAGPNDTLCIFDGLLQLTGFTPATGGQWSGAGITDPTTGVFDPLVTGGGLHPLIYSFGVGNCNQLDTSTVLVIAVNIEAGPDRAVCAADAPFALNNFNPATGGSWSGVGITNAAGNFDPGTAGVGSHVLNYAFVDPVLGCTFRDSMTIIVHPMPESDFAPLTATCIDEVIQFQNLSISTFDVLWDFGDGQTSILAQPTHTYTDTGTYTIQLTTTTEFGCSDMRTRTIFVTEPPFAFFTPLPDSGCAVLPVLFKNDSYGWQTTYNWAFGNIQTDSLYTPGLVLLPGGTKDTFYIITLTATNLCAVRTWKDSILVHPLPIVEFGTTTDTICSGEQILFANTSLGQPESFIWDFGNGLTSTDSLPNPMLYFTDSVFRTYTIRLIATNFCGSDTLERDITVKPVDVRAFFNVPNLIGCEPYTVQFSNFATPGATVFWQFGDGNTSSSVNPQHTFQDPGIYKVIQKVSAGCGFDSTIAYITVLPAPEVSFVCLPQICKEADLAFTNTSLSPLSGVHWNFGDGDSSLLNNPSHSFDLAGISTVVLTGISAVNGCPGTFALPVNVLELPNVNIATDKPDGCVPLSVGFQIQAQGATYFEWDFGDGNTALGAMPSHTFNAPGQYEIYLEGIDLNGCRNDTLLRYITVHPIPSPAFTMQRDRLCGLPVVVDFTNNTPDAVGYTWDFGDMTGTSVVNNPQHSYTMAGDYLVQLIAENAFMCRDTAAQIFSAYAQPIADFSWDPEEGCDPLTVLFENLSTFSTSAIWTFSDGGVSDTLEKTRHTFYDWGKQGATLIVSHREVCFDTLALSDIIEVFPSPTANFSFEEIVTDPPSGMFEFTDLSIGAVRWVWDFGDGDSSTLQNPSHRFYSNGQKLIKLTVWGENECPDDTIQGVTPLPMHGLFIPNAFTPGLDNGEAALFQPKGVGLREFEIAVYSSFGQLLWSSGTEALIDGQPGLGWDGHFKGTPMPQDVYTWQVKTAIFDDGTVWGGKKIGSVTLIR
jgi:PKD repeat protein